MARLDLLNRQRWIVFILPLAVFMLVGSLEPTPTEPGGGMIGLTIGYAWYPLVYGLKLLATLAAIVFVWPGYREFPFRVGPLGLAVGVVGVVFWVGLCWLDLEQAYLAPLLKVWKLDGLVPLGQRSAFNPWEQFGDAPLAVYAYLAMRFAGLALVVPLIEEFFYRGFVMRFPLRADWWNVPQGEVNATSIILAIALPMAMHPGELLAAAVWFGMVTWLYVRTRNVWDCVVAHAVTNLLLGIYVVFSGEWKLM